MKRLPLPLAFLAIALTTVLLLQYSRRHSAVGLPAPDFSLPDLQGHVHRLSDYQGKVVFLNFWATWCPPCRVEMPSMERLYQRLKHRDFILLAVSEDAAGPAAVEPFARSLGLTFPILLDRDGRLPIRYGVTGYPETLIIDQAGNVVEHHIGPADWESEEMVAPILALLDGVPEAAAGAARAGR